jgi:hypothetical protein
MMGPTSPSLFGVVAPHTVLQDDTQQTVSILLLCRPALRQALISNRVLAGDCET